jgi:glycosyltransferase involved in cell wall biosynthesis
MKAPLITVLLPAYNAEKYIGEAIQSVLAQSFTEFELLIVNDGSTDDTEKIIRSFSDPRIVLINQDNKGISAALNNGLSFAKADYIARFDADDICFPERLEKQYNFLIENPQYCIVGCDADYYDMNDNYVFTCYSPGHTNEEIQQIKMNICPFIHSGVLYKKKEILDAGGYTIHAHSFEDHFLWTKILKEGKAYNLNEVLLKVKLHPGSISIDEKWRSKRFCELKNAVLQKGVITEKEGKEFFRMLKLQDSSKIKYGSYYALLSKKYLWDNHQPGKSRQNIRKVLSFHPGDIKTYLLWVFSFFPRQIIRKIYDLSKPPHPSLPLKGKESQLTDPEYRIIQTSSTSKNF